MKRLTKLIIPQGIRKDRDTYFLTDLLPQYDGVVTTGSLTNVAIKESSTPTENLSTPKAFVQREYNDQVSVWFLTHNSSGNLFVKPESGNNAYEAIELGTATGDNWGTSGEDIGQSEAIEISQDNEIVYAGRKYIGKTITNQLNQALGSSDTTIYLDDITDFPTSGMAVIISSAGNVEVVSYTGVDSGSNSLTGVTRAQYNTTAQSFSVGSEVVGFRNKWLTFTSSIDSSKNIVSTSWEDWIFIGYENKVAGFSANDGSDFDEALLDLPSNYTINSIESVLAGNREIVLIGANKGNEGAIFVWDGVDTTWTRKIKVSEPIRGIIQTYVILGSGIYQTDGYRLKTLVKLPDDDDNPNKASLTFKGGSVFEKYLVLSLDTNSQNGVRNRNGLWILNLNDLSWSYHRPSSLSYSEAMGAIFLSSLNRIYIGGSYNSGSLDLFDSLDSVPKNAYGWFVYKPETAKKLVLEKVRITLEPFGLFRIYNVSNQSLNWEVVLRYYTFDRIFYQSGQVSSTSTDKSKITIYDSITPQVGDRIEIVDRESDVYPAITGETRKITAISHNTGAGTYELTVDSDFSDYPMSGQEVYIFPMRTISKTISITDLNTKIYKFSIDATGKPEFQQLLLEVEFRNNSGGGNIAPLKLSKIELECILKDD